MKARVLHFTAALALVTLGTACDSADKKTKSDAPAASSAKPKSKLEQAIAAATITPRRVLGDQRSTAELLLNLPLNEGLRWRSAGETLHWNRAAG